MKAEWPVCATRFIATALAEPDVILGIESAMHGLAAVQELTRLPELANTALKSIRVDKDKVSRALPVASRAEQGGKVKLVRGNWIPDFIDEATSFPNGTHDDQVDSVSGGFQMISQVDVGGYTFFAFGKGKSKQLMEKLNHESIRRRSSKQQGPISMYRSP